MVGEGKNGGKKFKNQRRIFCATGVNSGDRSNKYELALDYFLRLKIRPHAPIRRNLLAHIFVLSKVFAGLARFFYKGILEYFS